MLVMSHLHFLISSMWPLLFSSMSLSLVCSFLWFMGLLDDVDTGEAMIWVFFFFIIICSSGGKWGSDCHKESSLGYHSSFFISMSKCSMSLFITSEVFFFVGFFWGFFHVFGGLDSLFSGSMIIKGSDSVNPLGVPLFNSVILLSSGISVSFGHYAFYSFFSPFSGFIWFFISFLLGALFLSLQCFEYGSSEPCVSDGGYPSVFFVATGFHGAHVFLGALLLCKSSTLSLFGKLNSFNSISMDMFIWYWHFVDVVWFFLFFFFYVWVDNQNNHL